MEATMLQTQNADSTPSAAAAKEACEFPPPAKDLADASFLRRDLAKKQAGREEIIAYAIIDEIDLLVGEALGQRAITRLFQGAGLDKGKALEAFLGRRRALQEESMETTIAALTGANWDEISVRWQQAQQMGTPQDPEHIARRFTKELAQHTGLRSLVIETVARLTAPSVTDYDTRKSEVTEQFEDMFKDSCKATPSDIALYVSRVFGSNLISAAKNVGVFLFRSIITQNLPRFIKEKLKIEPKEDASFHASLLVSGAASVALAAHTLSLLFPSLNSGPQASPEDTIGAYIIAPIVAGTLEMVGRTIAGEGSGWTLLELAAIPFKALTKGIKGIAPLKEEIEKDKIRRLKREGF